ncbi:MAG: NAD(P)(+) transhydrogenase (Re/Si-specific) subunit beta [Bacteroidetes bacterium]|nr:NAD(P)(+) transhydrogenase (Re/Si-specific) subunit beta [Bacteroidota bacterium]MBK7969735.1 NAD(P)(+) transhydrogenase (Re/Si-specific) subunit beta [Bacteroidota bacterium]MBK8417221.1 NAD(P)(+) transhydrogenase (Re/Si-specific) subunit beta [Bacteroidota bacterium]MBK9425625.1 NAD(P)(+) transhydrogenase (Re/Si-specific) subunit beta [Bacteroidota bacterium]MBL0071346.1 NAD(P)(+) transhydrogenase (Re/Si-specific) subunit beta [Bacteroidota bacterium]
MIQNILEISYLIASVTFIMGLRMMSNPKSARKGNLVAAAGMAIAIAGTIFLYENGSGYTSREGVKMALIFAAILVGTIIGWMTAKKVQMTKMPELVSMFNGMGGACAALIGLMEFHHNVGNTGPQMAVVLGMIIGSVSFSGSIVAFLKLNGTMNKPVRLPSYNIINTIIMIGVLAYGAFMIFSGTDSSVLLYLLFALALFYGVMFVIPIGGADMPVVISLLNSFTGLAAAFGGFLYDNKVMLTGGILVGSAGTLLTIVMCKAMNRPLSNVIFGAFGATGATAVAGSSMQGSIKDINVNDAAVLMNYSKKVIIVPGYGLAVAQAQHVIHELETLLEERGVEVKYAIHPVAGRMPGHMNVLLAESNVDYGKLVEMEEINPEFATTDVVLVVGANDVVNPAAKNDPSSPIYGMPILDVENSQHILVNKRSMNAGYAGIENELFYNPKTSMLFGDAKDVLTKLVSELKAM